MERFVDLSMKMDLHVSDFREMRLVSKGDFDIAYSAVMGEGHKFISYAIMCYPRKIKSLLLLLLMGVDLDAYLQKLIVFKPGIWLC